MKILSFLFGGFIFSPYLCHRYTRRQCFCPVGRPLSPKASLPQAFFYAYKVSFSRQREKGLFNMAAA
jgi:hypothetical protein